MNIAQTVGFFVADRTEGESSTTYGTPKKLCTAEEVAVAYTKTPQKIYESGIVVFNRTYIPDAKVTLTSRTVQISDLLDMLFGLAEPSAGAGYEIGADTDVPTAYAIGWPELLDNGKYLCTWFYNATASPPDESYKTANESGYQIDPQSIEFSCVRDPHTGLLRRQKIVDDIAAVTAFYASVMPAGGT